MRTSMLLPLAAAGCLGAPTGIPRDAAGDDDAAGPIDAERIDAEPMKVWPPAGDVAFAAIAIADVAGDAAEDVIAVNVGDDAGGVYLLVAGTDLDPDISGLATTYTDRYDADLTAPVAAIVVDDKLVILDNPSTGARMTVLDENLDLVVTFATGGPAAPAGARQVLSPTTIGPNGGSLVFVNGDDVRLIDFLALEDDTPSIVMVPPPTGGWAGVHVVDVYESTGLVYLAGLGTAAWTCPVPMGGPMDAWTQERTGPAWSAQITGQVPDDGVDDLKVDLIGVDPDGANPAKICVLDVIADTTGTTCLTTAIPENAGHVLVHDNFAPGPELDLAVVTPGTTESKIEVFPLLRVTGTAVAADTSPAPASFPGANARVATGDLDTVAGPRHLVLLAESGALTCVTTRPEGTLECSD